MSLQIHTHTCIGVWSTFRIMQLWFHCVDRANCKIRCFFFAIICIHFVYIIFKCAIVNIQRKPTAHAQQRWTFWPTVGEIATSNAARIFWPYFLIINFWQSVTENDDHTLINYA